MDWPKKDDYVDVNTIIFSDESHIYLNVTLIANSPNVYIQVVVLIDKCSFHFC